MYTSYNNTNNPPVTNNPFIERHTNASNRYPDISTPPTVTQPQSTTWSDPTLSTGVQQQYQPDSYQQYSSIQQQQFPPGYTQQQQLSFPLQQSQPPQNYPQPYSQSRPQPPTHFQPSSSLGQNIQASISGSSYGYLQGHHQPPSQQSAYNPAQQQLQNNPNYIAQFDPYGSIPQTQGWADPNTSHSQFQSPAPSVSTTNNHNSGFGYGSNGNQNQINSGPSGDPHPREYIRSHKQELEAWDQYTWKQLLNSCEALKKAWDTKKNDLKDKAAGLQGQLRYAGYYDRAQIQQESGRVQGMYLDAQSKYDSVAASSFQFDEVYKGYKHSRDPPSKRRVREATNAALQSLPNWPES